MNVPAKQIFSDDEENLLAKAEELALKNLNEINPLPCNPDSDNKTGLLDPSAKVFRAGGDYPAQWTRDASINSWNAGSRISPQVARDTLIAVCEKLPRGGYIVQQDNQWWDQIVWAVAADNHRVLTDDRDFLDFAYQTAVNTYDLRREENFDVEFGLFKGGSVMNDGIAGYPSPPMDPSIPSSFVLDHPATRELMCCSTNALYCLALDSIAAMAAATGNDPERFREDRKALAASINKHLWLPHAGRWAYFIHGATPMRGKIDSTQEALGIAFAVLAGITPVNADPFACVHVEPYGVTASWPHFAPYSAEKPGRHNCMVWPMISGFWGEAALLNGHPELWRRELMTIATHAVEHGEFWELWNPRTGVPEAGHQHFDPWKACHDQTWSATAFLRLLNLKDKQ